MKYYDLIFDSCNVNKTIEQNLGFEKLFVIKKEDREKVYIDSNKPRLIKALQKNPVAIAITDFSIDRNLMAKIADNDTILCIPFELILQKNGFERSRLLYKASSLLKYAYNKRIEVSFASLADSNQFLNSHIQLIELAKLIGATEQQARLSISQINKKIGDSFGKD